MFLNKSRLERERLTVEEMIGLYCRSIHKRSRLCDECSELREYSGTRLKRCPFGDGKPVCSECKVHCYNKEMREKIRIIMKYSGPRMIFFHPLMAIMHIIDNRKAKKTVS